MTWADWATWVAARAGRMAEAARLRWASQGRAEQVTSLLIGSMVAAGIVLRVQGFGFPPRLTFDEQFYAPTAHHYLVGVPDLHDYHPPLGKILGAVGLLLFGYNSVGWRFTYLCFGVQTMVVAYWLAREIFAERRAGWLAAAFVAADGFFLSYSRCALLDGMLTCLVLWSLLAAVSARSSWGVAVTAIMVGLTASIKWSGALVLIPVVATLLVLRRVRWYTLAWFALTPLVHLGIWWFGLRLMGHASEPTAVARVLEQAVRYFISTGPHSNPLASPWYTWPLLYHPIVVKLSTHGATNRYASSVGNLALWVGALLAVVVLPLLRGLSAVRPRWRHWWPKFLDPVFTRAAMLLILGWLALLSMWTVALGKHTFFYHYLPSYGFALVLLAGLVARLERWRPAAVLGFMVLATMVAVYFVPVWCEFSLPEPAANRRLVFLPWRP